MFGAYLEYLVENTRSTSTRLCLQWHKYSWRKKCRKLPRSIFTQDIFIDYKSLNTFFFAKDSHTRSRSRRVTFRTRIRLQWSKIRPSWNLIIFSRSFYLFRQVHRPILRYIPPFLNHNRLEFHIHVICCVRIIARRRQYRVRILSPVKKTHRVDGTEESSKLCTNL